MSGFAFLLTSVNESVHAFGLATTWAMRVSLQLRRRTWLAGVLVPSLLYL
jgi:predicted RND superfamily exporter protein